ncbi:hypothetical protein ACQ4PT_006432 [Festuca glaucescens]
MAAPALMAGDFVPDAALGTVTALLEEKTRHDAEKQADVALICSTLIEFFQKTKPPPSKGITAARITHNPGFKVLYSETRTQIYAERMRKRNRHNLAGSVRRCGGDHPLHSRGHGDERRDWRNLASVLVEDIASRLLRYDVSEYIRLRAACKEWRNCTAEPREGDIRFRPRRWIMLSNRTDGDGRRFLNLFTGACARVDLPELYTQYLETSTEGLLLLRHKSSHAPRLLNPLTRALIDLPPITMDLGSAYDVWTGLFVCASRVIYAGISDETSPPSVVLLMTDGRGRAIVYAKPGDQRWAVMDDKPWRSLPVSYRY